MSTLDIWLIIAGLTIVTIVTRNFFIALGDTLRLPDRVLHALRYAPACALAGLIAPEVLMVQGALALPLTNPKLIAAVAALVVMLATRSMVWTMVVGMVVFTGTRFLVA
jgi:branched-subunit amino acid transport protein